MSYEEELRFKHTKVNDALYRIGRQNVAVSGIVGSEKIDDYRNKGILAVGSLDGKAVSGFYRERSHQIIPVKRCAIQDELTHRAAAALTDFMNDYGIPAYDEQRTNGIVRHVFCRRALNSGDRLLCIVARRGFGAKTKKLVDALRVACPELTGIVLNVNKTEGNTVLSGEFYTLWGKNTIRDTLCGLAFDIAPQAFFQINPPQAEKLYHKALEYATLTKNDLAFDLYCGAGTISLCLAREAGKVIGAEIVPEAIENANANASINGIENAEFLCADAGEAAKTLAARGLRPEVVVVDPPRKGMQEAAIASVASMSPARIVYVSCEPSTLARDILRFNSYGYALRSAEAYDLFPRTKHVETAALLVRQSL
jgi:23S rRNA (uracil-5-)-methyltransferase RumA